MMITCETTMNESAFKAMVDCHNKNNKTIKRYRYFLTIMAIILLLIVCVLFIAANENKFYIAIFSIFSFFLLWYAWKGITLQHYRMFKKTAYKNGEKKVNYLFSKENIQINGHNGESKYYWSAVNAAFDVPGYYILSIGDAENTYIVVDKTGFIDGNAEQFEHLLTDKLGELIIS